MQLAIKKAKDVGVGLVSLRGGSAGAISYYSMMALRHDCIGIAGANAVPRAAAWGGIDPVLGLNPYSVAIPAGKHFPVVLDMSIVGMGRVSGREQYEDSFLLGKPPSEGLFVDEKGETIRDAERFKLYRQKGLGAYLPLSPREFGLDMVMDLICGGLADAACAKDVDLGQSDDMSKPQPQPQGD